MSAPPIRFTRAIALATIAGVAAACGTGAGNAGPIVTRLPASDVPITSPIPASQAPGPTDGTGPTPDPASPAPTATPAATSPVKVYFLLDEHLVAVQRSVPQTVAVGRAALNELIGGPTASESGLSSSVPAGTLLLGLDISNGLATVDLSREFESGGGSASMFSRLAQVVYTLTQFSTVDAVAFRLDGEPVTVFSGEGILLDHPSVRADYVSFLPPIFLDRPAWNGVLANPGHVAGLANVFEATFLVEIRDATGRTLAKQQVMATCGTGCWGTFDATVPYSVASTQSGTVSVYDLSAKDGSVRDLVTYPVTLTP